MPPTQEQVRSPQTAAEQAVDDTPTVKSILDFNTARDKFTSLVQDWEDERIQTERNRRIRKIEVDMEQLRASGKLKADEVLIGVRVIDENIRKEQPIFVNYFTRSRRLAIFDPMTKPNLNTQSIRD